MAIMLLTLLVLSSLSWALSDFNQWPHQRVALPDVSIHLRYFGNGPPLILLHGFPEHSVCYYYLVVCFSKLILTAAAHMVQSGPNSGSEIHSDCS